MYITELAKYMLGRLEEWKRGNQRGATIAVVGQQGSGKTTYAYYSIKQAYILYTCKDSRGPTACIKRRFEESCWGATCKEPDEVDKELRQYVYVSVDDIPRLIDEIATRGEVAPFVLIDDLGVTRSSYFDPHLRPLYLRFLRMEEWRRALTVNLVLTTVYDTRLPKDMRDTALYVYASYHQILRLEDRQVNRAYRYIAVRRSRALTDDGPRVVYHRLWVEVIPSSPEWAMPPWLAQLIDERKRALLKTR